MSDAEDCRAGSFEKPSNNHTHLEPNARVDDNCSRPWSAPQMKLIVPSLENTTLKSKVAEALQGIEPVPSERHSACHIGVIELANAQWLICCCMKIILVVTTVPRFVWSHRRTSCKMT